MIYLSIILPIRNEAEHIARVLDRLLEQNYDHDKLEIIVADGLSEDMTPQIIQEYVEKHPHVVRYFVNSKKLSSAARNIGIQNAQGEYVLIIDGHCIIDNDDMLRNVSDAFEKTEADCLGRPQPLEMKDATTLQWAIAIARRSPLGHHPDSFIYSGQAQFSPASSVAVSYKKSIFEQVGYFDESFDAAEDVEMNTRIDKAGLKCYFDPSIAVRYVPRGTLKGLGIQMQRYGCGRVRLWRKHRDTFSWKSFAPALLPLGIWSAVALFFSFLCLILVHNILVLTVNFSPEFLKATAHICTFLIAVVWLYGMVVICLPYSVIVVAESIRLAIKQRRLDILRFLPGVFSTIHFSYGNGILREFFFPKRR
jgi:succinoglycan biosynthesis protein ExoA